MNLELFLSGLARLSAQAGVLVLLVLLVQGIFRRQLTPRWRCALWLLVFVRLLLPISPGSVMSIYNLARWNDAPTSAPGNSATLVAPPVMTHAMEAAPLPANLPLVTRQRVVTESVSPATDPATRMTANPALATAAPAPEIIHRSWTAVLFWCWLAGALLLLAYVVISSVRLAWRSRGLQPVSDGALLDLLDECAGQLGISRPPTVVESPAVAGPALYGLFRPRLLLPANFTRSFLPQELRFVFLHELAHLKRRDLPLNWLVALLQILHWFNPLVWLGFARWRADREIACDALALEAAGGEQNREYGRTILHLLEHFTHRAPVPGLVGILEDKRQLRRRIGMIASFRPGSRWGLLSAFLIAVLALVGLTDAQTAKPQKAPDHSSPTIATNRPAATNDTRVGTDPKPEASVTNAEMRSLTVTVLAPDGKALAGAEVSAPYLGGWTQTMPKRLTDAQGKFTLRFPMAPKEFRRQMSNFSVSASHKNYASRSVMWTSSGGDVYGGMPEEVTIKLEPGITIGGVVQDERGAPLAGVRVLLAGSSYRGFTMGNTERKTHEYSEIWQTDTKLPAAVTDAAGRWTAAHFPPDLGQLEVTFVRPDDSRESFATPQKEDGLNQHPPISLADLKAGKAIVKLQEGVTVRGIVVDENGKPLSGVTVREGYGHGNIVRAGEFTTGDDGRFERGHRVPRQWIYTASRADRATVSVVAQVDGGMPEVRLVLPPAQPWQARVTDEAGRPLSDVELRLDTYRTEAQILDWQGKTDADGRVVWTNAPTVDVTFYAISKALGATRKIKIVHSDAEQLIVLSKASAEKIVVHIKAVDLETRQPVTVQSVAARFEGGGSPFRTLAEPRTNDFTVEIKRTDFRVGMYPSYELKLDAEGHMTLTTESRDFDLGDQDWELAFRRSTGAGEVVVMQPDGQPAAGARLWVRTTPDGGSLFINSPERYYGDRLERAQADEQGRVKLPGAAADAPVVITHTNGFLATTMAELGSKTEVQLPAYGVVEGRLLVAGKPKSGANISLATLVWSPAEGYNLSYTATTDAEGKFSFTQVPPGECKLYRWALPKRSNTSGIAITETWQRPVTVAAGQTNQVEYSCAGRAVIGQAIPEEQGILVDWQNDVHTLSLKLPKAEEPARPNREDYATFEAFRKANNAAFTSGARQTAARLARTYPLEIETDGSFRIEDVPPGTYELRIRVTRPDENINARPRPFGSEEELGLLTREVVVPEGKEPLDLGTLKVDVMEVRGMKSSVPMTFTGQTLGGTPLSLAQLKGKTLLVVFWASWSERSLEQLVELKKLQSQYASDPRVVFVGMNLDETAEAARKVVDANGYNWPQVWLEGAARAQQTAAFEVNALPAVFLLDSTGRIMGRELEGDRLKSILTRTLATRVWRGNN